MQPLRSVLLLLLLGACQRDEGPAVAQAEPPPPIEVTLVDVRTAEVPRTVLVTGSLLAPQQAEVAAEVGGRVVRTHVEVGARVSQGDPLVSLDDEALRLQSDEAKAQLGATQVQVDQATVDCERATQLAAIGGMTEADRLRTLAQCAAGVHNVEAVTARVGSIRSSLQRTTIRAPFSGVVAERMVNTGSFVGPGRAVARVVATSPLTLSLSVPERASGQVALGQTLQFEPASHPGQRFSGTVDRASPALRERTRDRLVEAIIPNDDGRLLPGTFAVGWITTGTSPGQLVPEAAIVSRSGDPHLFVAVDGAVEERVVEVGVTLDGWVEILRGANAGERVISPVTETVVDGARIAGEAPDVVR